MKKYTKSKCKSYHPKYFTLYHDIYELCEVPSTHVPAPFDSLKTSFGEFDEKRKQ